MEVTKKCLFCGKYHTRDLPVTEEQLQHINTRRERGDKIQDAAPQLNADDREFLLTGVMPEEWDYMFKEDD